MAGQIEGAASRRAAPPRADADASLATKSRPDAVVPDPSHGRSSDFPSAADGPVSMVSRGSAVMSSTADSTRTSNTRFTEASTISTLRPREPARKRATRSRGRDVAERPMRWRGRPTSRITRSMESARWAPRLVPTMAWISSMITVSTVRRISRASEVRIRKSDSGVVMRMSGGSRRIFWRSLCGVSPERTATRGTR